MTRWLLLVICGVFVGAVLRRIGKLQKQSTKLQRRFAALGEEYGHLKTDVAAKEIRAARVRGRRPTPGACISLAAMASLLA